MLHLCVKERSDVSEMNELEKETMDEDENDIDQLIFPSPEKGKFHLSIKYFCYKI